MDDLNRRAFLKSAGLAFAGVVGAASFAAARQQEEEEEARKDEEEKEEELDYDALFSEDSGGDEDTRACPQCGALMYRQGRTWTCENCGYSYVE